MHVRSCHIDYDRDMAIVAEIRQDQKKRLIGIGSLDHRRQRRRRRGNLPSSFTTSSRDGDWPPSSWMSSSGSPRSGACKEFYGFLEPTNGRMTALCEKLGMTRSASPTISCGSVSPWSGRQGQPARSRSGSEQEGRSAAAERPVPSGGERGIRTPVRAFGPQIDFESIPLRPLRYLSGLSFHIRRIVLPTARLQATVIRPGRRLFFRPRGKRRRPCRSYGGDVSLFSRKNPLKISRACLPEDPLRDRDGVVRTAGHRRGDRG